MRVVLFFFLSFNHYPPIDRSCSARAKRSRVFLISGAIPARKKTPFSPLRPIFCLCYCSARGFRARSRRKIVKKRRKGLGRSGRKENPKISYRFSFVLERFLLLRARPRLSSLSPSLSPPSRCFSSHFFPPLTFSFSLLPLLFLFSLFFSILPPLPLTPPPPSNSLGRGGSRLWPRCKPSSKAASGPWACRSRPCAQPAAQPEETRRLLPSGARSSARSKRARSPRTGPSTRRWPWSAPWPSR